MPLREYHCDSCGNSHEILVSINDETPKHQPCPECGRPALYRLGSPAVHFKGSGFYSTDYGKKPTSGKQETRAPNVKVSRVKEEE